jgi:hypothetical protein
MATLTTQAASVTVLSVSPVRVQAAAPARPAKRRFARFLTVLLRALAAMQA